MKRWLSWTAGVIGALLAVLVFYVAVNVYEVWHWAKADQARKVDAIVVLGAAQYNGHPSAVLKSRLDHAAGLWKEGDAKTIVVTGGKEPGDAHTEAGASAAYLAEVGVPDSDVLREVQGRTSWESLEAAAHFMEARDIHSVLLVSDSFHDARIRAMAQQLKLTPYVSPTRTSPIVGSARYPYVLKEVGELSVGRIIGFDRIGGLERLLGTGNQQ